MKLAVEQKILSNFERILAEDIEFFPPVSKKKKN